MGIFLMGCALLWLGVACYRSGKRTGSRQGFHVGRRRRRH